MVHISTGKEIKYLRKGASCQLGSTLLLSTASKNGQYRTMILYLKQVACAYDFLGPRK